MELLNNRESKKILHLFEEQWGCTLNDLLSTYSLALTGKDKVYLFNREIHRIHLDVTINSIGLYIANMKGTQIRLTIEGAQLIGPVATKNIVEISAQEAQVWIRGNDLPKQGSWTGFVIIKQGSDYLGCGHFKEGVIANYVPKTRRIHSSN
jgi:NOL1/NOP2/fmu family ribosome biogenesis protein